jgi:DNA polymerase-4
MPLRYLYIDMNAFFASVEQQMRPELRGQPVAVVPVLAETTCCIAASYEAKSYGIRTGTKVYEARRLCPGLHVVEARPRFYVMIHQRLVRVVESCLPVAAVCSIDELVCRLIGDEQQPDRARHCAERIKAAIRRDLGPYLRCSIGLGPNRLLAKVATDMQKPDGVKVIHSSELPVCLYALRLTDFPGIGPRREQRLKRWGITTVAHLCRLSAAELAAIWNSR